VLSVYSNEPFVFALNVPLSWIEPGSDCVCDLKHGLAVFEQDAFRQPFRKVYCEGIGALASLHQIRVELLQLELHMYNGVPH